MVEELFSVGLMDKWLLKNVADFFSQMFGG
jgi:hypothetical protein